MPRRKASARGFLQEYAGHLSMLQDASRQAESLVKSILRDLRSDLHLVSSRAKDQESALWKVLRKSYASPIDQLTDKIGVRVITYYQSDVDRVVTKLVQEFEIDPIRSVDKRSALYLREFGYRSVHLVAKLKGHRATSPEYQALAGQWFEIQIRSILEHAWAEIEHEVVYKSGIKYPEEDLRRFAAIAGTLELIEKEFLALREKREDLIERYRHRYDLNADGEVGMDTARLLGFLESQLPRNPSWREAEKSGKPFPANIEDRCVGALKQARLNTANALRKAFRSKSYKKAVRRFAASQLLLTTEVSHLAMLVLCPINN